MVEKETTRGGALSPRSFTARSSAARRRRRRRRSLSLARVPLLQVFEDYTPNAELAARNYTGPTYWKLPQVFYPNHTRVEPYLLDARIYDSSRSTQTRPISCSRPLVDMAVCGRDGS